MFVLNNRDPLRTGEQHKISRLVIAEDERRTVEEAAVDRSNKADNTTVAAVLYGVVGPIYDRLRSRSLGTKIENRFDGWDGSDPSLRPYQELQ
jgi:hypothetical protein